MLAPEQDAAKDTENSSVDAEGSDIDEYNLALFNYFAMNAGPRAEAGSSNSGQARIKTT